MRGECQVADLTLMIRGRSRRPNHMRSQIGNPKAMTPVAFRRFPSGLHSVAKQASFYIAFWNNSMCFARTAALHCGNEKQKGNASRVFLQPFLHPVDKCRQERKMCQHMANLGFQNRGWSAQRREKNEQKVRQMQQDAKNAPKQRLRAKNVPT